ncbi:MAG TPA: gas vesicle protein [Marmoricola sp.]|jgi:hypothetical protein
MAESLSKMAQRTLKELESLVGCPAEGVVGVHKDGDGWVVEVEVLEIGRVPETTDVLATYEVTVDTDGELTGYHRVRRYLRAQVED